MSLRKTPENPTPEPSQSLSGQVSSTTAAPEAEPEILAPADFDQPAAADEPARDGDVLLSPEEFFDTFRTAFNVAAAAPTIIPPRSPPLASMQVAEGDQQARDASDALYGIIAETPWLHFLIQPQSVWFKRIVALGGFAFMKAMAVNAELAERREVKIAKAKAQAASAQAARDAGAGVGVKAGRYEDRGGEVVLAAGQAA